MKSLLFIALSLLIAALIFNSTFALNKGQAGDSNETGMNHYDDKAKSTAAAQHLDVGSLIPDSNKMASKNDISLDQSLLSGNQSGQGRFNFSEWHDPFESCNAKFSCTINASTGWKDKNSIQFSTNNTKNKTSKIVGQEVNVRPKESYHFVFHVKLNQWATNSRVELNGFDGTTKRWYVIDNCPTYFLKGPLDWQEFSCGITIEGNTTKVRPILQAGWSSQPKKEATTWFDSLYFIKFGPFLTDPNLTTQVVYQGLNYPVSMGFLGPNDFLVIENNGTVQRIVNGVELTKPVLHLDVTRDGLLGIAIQKNMSRTATGKTEPTYVFLYFTGTTNDVDKVLRNRLYRYEFVNNTLVNPKLLLDLPAGFLHNGGPILIGHDKQIYIMIGELDNTTIIPHLKNKALNYGGKAAKEPDGRGGVLRIDQNGEPIDAHGLLPNKEPLNKYFAYGIRNSFGMDFDPLTGKLWDTENGPSFGDEINLVDPGFNGGWNKVQGIWYHTSEDRVIDSDITYNPSGLVDFDGKGKYRSPEFVWKYTVGPTALKFLSTDKLGKEYENDIFVGDVNNGRIYHFKLNQNRTGLLLEGPLMDKVADTDGELDNVIFGGDFGIITDLKVGPDGYLYFVVFNEGKIYRIVPRT